MNDPDINIPRDDPMRGELEQSCEKQPNGYVIRAPNEMGEIEPVYVNEAFIDAIVEEYGDG